MIPVLVLTHGDLASELLHAARTIDPSLTDQTSAMSLPWDVDSDEASQSLKKQLRELDQGEGTSDLDRYVRRHRYKPRPPVSRSRQVEVVTGVNLPMLVKLGSMSGHSLTLRSLLNGLTVAGQKSIRVASEFLHAKASH